MKQRSEADWERLIADYHASGKSLTAYSSANNISRSWFGERLRRQRKSAQSAHPQSQKLIPVQVNKGRSTLYILRYQNLALELPGESNVEHIAQLLKALSPCRV